MASLTQAFNALRSTVTPAVRWATQGRQYQLARRLAYAPRLGAVGALAGAGAGAMTSDGRHRVRGAVLGGMLGAGAGLRPGRMRLMAPTIKGYL
jgi:hypothetical protein